MKSRRTVDTVAVEQCHGRHLELGTHVHKFLGSRGSFEKAEGGAGVKFDKQSSQFSVLGSQFSERLFVPRFSLRTENWELRTVLVIHSFDKPLPIHLVLHQAIEDKSAFGGDGNVPFLA